MLHKLPTLHWECQLWAIFCLRKCLCEDLVGWTKVSQHTLGLGGVLCPGGLTVIAVTYRSHFRRVVIISAEILTCT